jgi:hypothetical protein
MAPQSTVYKLVSSVLSVYLKVCFLTSFINKLVYIFQVKCLIFMLFMTIIETKTTPTPRLPSRVKVCFCPPVKSWHTRSPTPRVSRSSNENHRARAPHHDLVIIEDIRGRRGNAYLGQGVRLDERTFLCRSSRTSL